MKETLILSVLLATQMALATTGGESKECYDVAVSVGSKLGDYGVEGSSHLIKSSGILCTSEKNMKAIDEDEMVRVGQISVTVYDGKKAVARYELGASSGEGAAGTYYETYARNAQELNVDINDSNVNGKVITFVLRNGPVKKGQYAGRVILFGQHLALFQR